MILPPTDLVGAALSMIGAFFVSIESILVRKSTVKGSITELIGTILFVNVIIWSLASFFSYYPNFDINLEAFLAFSLSGIFGFFIGYFLLFVSIKRVGASRTLPLIRSQVIVALFLSIFFLQESLTPYHIAGIFIILIGTVFVSREMSDGDSYIKGNKIRNLLLPIFAGVSWGLNWFFSKLGLLQGIPVVLGLTVSSIMALVSFSIFRGINEKKLPTPKINSPNFIWFFAIGIMCALAFFMNFLALSISRVMVVSPIWQITPLFVLLLSHIFLPKLEKVTLKLIIGSLLIVGGAIIVIIFM